jgi:hypothetical protein
MDWRLVLRGHETHRTHPRLSYFRIIARIATATGIKTSVHLRLGASNALLIVNSAFGESQVLKGLVGLYRFGANES